MRQLFKVNRKAILQPWVAGGRTSGGVKPWPGMTALVVLLLFCLLSGVQAQSSCLTGFALYSHDQTLLRDQVTVESGKTGSNGYLELGVDGIAKGDFVSGQNTLLRDRVTVMGNATAAGTVTLSSGASVSGFI